MKIPMGAQYAMLGLVVVMLILFMRLEAAENRVAALEKSTRTFVDQAEFLVLMDLAWDQKMAGHDLTDARPAEETL